MTGPTRAMLFTLLALSLAGSSACAARPPAKTVRSGAWSIDPFYANRPGPEFRIGAGKPFGRAFDGERHLADVRQLTFGGENAEAYFSPDGRKLILQTTPREGGCDQEYVLDLSDGAVIRVSSGKGRTTCGYFEWPSGDRIVYASTEAASDACPPPPDRSSGYVWPLYPGYDIYEAAADGSGARRITETPGYDAEMTWCHRGGKAIFTSVRDGDLELYVRDASGAVTRITRAPGLDGGAFFSPDCREIVWRGDRPTDGELDAYRSLLGQGLIRPRRAEILVARADGTDVRQLTNNGAANWAPYFSPDGARIIYTSNYPGGRGEFDLYMIDKNGGEPERITTAPGFDGFPVFSPDGLYLVWASNRENPEGSETDIFIARWVE